ISLMFLTGPFGQTLLEHINTLSSQNRAIRPAERNTRLSSTSIRPTILAVIQRTNKIEFCTQRL
ncbi:MAG: hypothetical protein KAT44_08500, partial [Pirellulales bacterium]|nr:hypothetical protein [Pirellulales bacterium]